MSRCQVVVISEAMQRRSGDGDARRALNTRNYELIWVNNKGQQFMFRKLPG